MGSQDLYGKAKFGGADHIAHEIACASALLMGQTSEGIPAVIIRGYKYVKSGEGTSDYQPKAGALKTVIREILKTSTKILGLKWLLKLFLTAH